MFCKVTEEELPFKVVKLLSPGLVVLTLTPPLVKFSIKKVCEVKFSTIVAVFPMTLSTNKSAV